MNLFGKADFLMEISTGGSVSTAVNIEDCEMFRGSDRNFSLYLAIGALACSSLWLVYTYSRLCIFSSSVFDVVDGFGSLFKMIYDTILCILTIVTMGMVVAVFSNDSRENAILAVLSDQSASSYPTEFSNELKIQAQLRILLVMNTVAVAFRVLGFASLLRNLTIIVKTLTHALKGVNVVVFIFAFLFVTFTYSAYVDS